MNATTTRLNAMTVTMLKGIARNMSIKGVSTLRKAALIDVLTVAIDKAHADALIADSMYEPTRKMVAALDTLVAAKPAISLMDYPVPYGRPVTEAHTRICATRGHVSYVKDGMDMGYCPRCGEVTTSEEQVTQEEITAKPIIEPFADNIPSDTYSLNCAPVKDDAMARIREVMSDGSAFAPAFLNTTVSDSVKTEKDEDITLDIFLSRVMTAIAPMQELAASIERTAWEADNPEAECWTTVSKDLTTALSNIEWLAHYRRTPEINV